jgi:branched-chain amino acid aminotransferase
MTGDGDGLLDHGLVWSEGIVEGGRAAKVSVFDRGFTVGDGVFETLVVRHGVPFAWTRHLERLIAASETMDLTLGTAAQTLRGAVDELVGVWVAAGGGHGRLRITVTSGADPRTTETPPTLVVTLTPLPSPTPTASVVRVSWVRNERSSTAGVKTTSYAENVRALAAAHARGATEAVMANTVGNLCEGSATNVFVGIDGVLCTPPLTSGCLPGVTRALVLASGCGAVERDITFDDLDRAQEMFLTSSLRDIQPVTSLDGRPLPGAPGPLTARAIEAYGQLATNPDP